YQALGYRVLANQKVVDRLLDEESGNVAELECLKAVERAGEARPRATVEIIKPNPSGRWQGCPSKRTMLPDLWASAKARQVRIARLELDGLQLGLKEDKDGHWALQGLPVQDDKPFDPEQALKQMQMISQLSVFDSQITLQPYEQSPLTLTYVSMTL
nr:hypothetical protein [Tanacetum cinerariifolium]